MRGLWAALVAAAALVGVVAPALGQGTTITLRSVAQVRAGGGVTLGDVAQVAGDEAERLAAVEVLGAGEAAAMARGGRLEIDPLTVRSALDGAGVNWGRVVMSGGTVGVRIIGEAVEGQRPARQEARPAGRAAESVPQTVDLSGPPTVRTHVAARLADLFAVAPGDLRLKFRAEDEVVLATPTTGRRVDVQPGASASSARMPVRVYVYAGDRIVTSATITAEVLVRREVVTAAAVIGRGQTITGDLVSAGVQWMEPNARVPAAAAQVLGASGGGTLARARINAGEVITVEAIEAPLAAKRGDLVTVHCLSGSVTVRVRARAMAAIRDGEIGPFRLEGGQRMFHARMDGPGRAVMVTDTGGAGSEGGRAGTLAMESAR